MDYITSLAVRFLAGISSYEKLMRNFDRWSFGKKIKVLLVCNNEFNDVGEDIRTSVIVSQIEDALGRENVEISVLTHNEQNLREYIKPYIKTISFSKMPFIDLLKACSSHHIAVLCHGTLLNSKISNTSSLFYCLASGIMKNQNKPCIAFGTEIGQLDEIIIKMVLEMCEDTYFITRTKASLRMVNVMECNGHVGVEAAHFFENVSKKEKIKNDLLRSGWDGKKPLVGVAVSNPFSWPVKSSIFAAAKSLITGNKKMYYKMRYFHSWSDERENQYKNYLQSIAFAINKYKEISDFHLVIIGMSDRDHNSCKELQEYLRKPGTVFSCKDYNGHEIKEVLGSLSMLITSNYYARALSYQQKVPAIGIFADDSAEDAFDETGYGDRFYFRADESELGRKIYLSIKAVKNNENMLYREMNNTMDYYQRKTEQMELFLNQFVKSSFPGVRVRPIIRGKSNVGEVG